MSDEGKNGPEDAVAEDAESTSPEKEEEAAPALREEAAPALHEDALPDAAKEPPGPIIISPTKAYALAALSGVLAMVSFAGIDIWPFALVCWVPMLLALRNQPPKRALFIGWTQGFVMTMSGFYWLTPMLQEFSGFPLPVCVLFACLVCLQMGGRIALCTWLYARSATRGGWHPAASFLGAFAASELIYPLLFPWYFGAFVHSVPLLAQTADVGGPILVSLVLVCVNLVVAELLHKPVFGERPDKRVLRLAAVPVAALVYGLVRMPMIDAAVASAERIKVGMIQGASPLKKRSNALRTHLLQNKELLKEEPDLVVWSEGAAHRRYDVKRYERRIKGEIGRHLKVPSIVGLLLYERLPVQASKPGRKRRARYFNTAVMLDEQGEVKGRYDKQFLLMFGEYIPFGDKFPVLYDWSPNSSEFTPGESFEPLPFGDGHRISTMICYEDIIPSFVSKLVSVGNPDLLVNMTNDTWFGDSIEPYQHLALAKMRSIEHRLFMVRVTNSGVSAIIDPVGRTPVETTIDLENPQSTTGDVAFLQLSTPYKAIGDIPWYLVTALMALAAFTRKK